MHWFLRTGQSGRLDIFFCFCALFTLLHAPSASGGVQQWTFGGAGSQWQDEGVMEGLETTPQQELRPAFTRPDQNLALTAVARGGGIDSPLPTLKSTSLPGNALANMIDGDPEVAFKSELSINHGVFIVLDLGASLGVNRIVFYSREFTGGEESPFLQGYRLFINDGRPETQSQAGPIWTLVDRRSPNRNPRVEVEFPLQFVRYIKLESLVAFEWEIAELEVYGEGFAPKATYTSKVLEVPGASEQSGMANWGKLRWSHTSDPEATISLLVRSGETADPNRYFRVEVDELTKERTLEPITEEEYEQLGEPNAIKELDSDHWSDWSEPLPLTGEEQITAPAPRSYFQFKVEFESRAFSATAVLASLSIEYSVPPLARQITAAIAPRRTEAGVSTSFTYSLMAAIDSAAGHPGFDAVEIATPARPVFRGLTIDDLPIDLAPDNITTALDHLGLRFPEHRVDRDGTALKVLFDCPVYAFGTAFEGRVFDTASDELPQSVVPDEMIDPRALSVEVIIEESILTALQVKSNPFTPNGDGRNDAASISYSILKVSEPIPVSVEIYGLAGRLVRNLFAGSEPSGNHRHAWDGRDNEGKLVPPGIYIGWVTAEGVAITERKGTGIMVIY